jgi:3-hydroxyisobutyrate dehydrogenase-like beta-hydroxyacid dehydrogenase
MNKDVHFAKEVADDMGKEVPSLRRVVIVYEQAMEKGLEKEDFSATYKIVNHEWSK